jgi:hypothetical protein
MKNFYYSDTGYTFSLPLSKFTVEAAEISSVTLCIYDGAGRKVKGAGALECKIADDQAIAHLPGRLCYDIYRLHYTATTGSGQQVYKESLRLVGYPYFTLAELTEIAAGIEPINFESLRTRVEERFESLCRRAFRPTPHREVFISDGLRLLNPTYADIKKLYSVLADGKRQQAHITPSRGHIELSAPLPYGSEVAVHYLYGHSMYEDVKRACILLAIDGMSDQAPNITEERFDGGFIRRTVGGVNGATNIPEVNEIIKRIGLRRPLYG